MQCEPPRDVEDYIHRSGRTGRAGINGIILLVKNLQCWGYQLFGNTGVDGIEHFR